MLTNLANTRTLDPVEDKVKIDYNFSMIRDYSRERDVWQADSSSP
jgi:hypothetical protein